jgi:chemotaxis protein methyltransferase CheR
VIPSFERLAVFVKSISGIVLDPEKQFIVESRLLPIVRARGFDNVAALIERLLDFREQGLVEDVIDALTTNETFFFRDRAPFEAFGTIVLPYLIQARERERNIRIWCNACSTGQEPYSLAMTIDEAASRLAGWRIDLQATDVSRAAIQAAREGLYNQFEVQRGLPANVLLRYFSREREMWRIAEHVRARVRFATFNLLKSFEERGLFDVIFCRNVLIYFDQNTKRDILMRLSRSLRKDGFLVLGSTETVMTADGQWVNAEASPLLYVKPDSPHALQRDRLRA